MPVSQSSLIPRQERSDRYQHPLVAILREYAKMFGDFETPLLHCANQVRKLSSLDDVRMFKLMTEAIRENGCRTIADLIDETKIPEADVRRIYHDLLIDFDYEERPVSLKTAGPRTLGIFHISEPPGDVADGLTPRRVYGQYSDDEEDDDDEE